MVVSMTTFENHAPHTLNVFSATDVVADGRNFRLVDDSTEPFLSIPSGNVVRVSMRTADITENWGGVPVRFLSIGEVDALPAPREGVVHVVALPCVEQYLAQGRRDIAIVDRTVVNSAGRVVGCLGFSLVTR
jgi:hypothetical protein